MVDESSGLQRDLQLHREELAAQNEELRRTNEALEATRARLARLWDTAPVAFFTVGADGKVVDVNAAGAALVGGARAAVLGTEFEFLVAPAERGAFRTFLRTLRPDGALEGDTAMVSAGRAFPVRLRGTLLHHLPGGTLSLLCVTDETLRRERDVEERRMAARLAQAQHLESLDVLAGGVAHDFNNLLTVILANVEILLDDHPQDTGLLAGLADVREAGERAADLSRQMLAYCGRTVVRPLDVSPAAAVHGMAGLLHSVVHRGIELVITIPDDLPTMRVEPVQVHQILLNLVINASEAIGHRTGRIQVSACLRSPTEGPGVGTGPFVCLEVRDDGPGMDAATRLRAFEPFFSTKTVGRGLGLAVVHGNTRSHGGVVELETAPGAGGLFPRVPPGVAAGHRGGNGAGAAGGLGCQRRGPGGGRRGDPAPRGVAPGAEVWSHGAHRRGRP